MARFSDRTKGHSRSQGKHGLKASFTGNTPEQAIKAAKKAYFNISNPNAGKRTITKPEQLNNGQWRVYVK